MSHRCRSRLLSLLVASFLLASPVLALGGDPARQEREPGLFAALWQLVGNLIYSVESARGTMDPNGQPLSGAGTMDSDNQTSSVTESDARGTMDPNG